VSGFVTITNRRNMVDLLTTNGGLLFQFYNSLLNNYLCVYVVEGTYQNRT